MKKLLIVFTIVIACGLNTYGQSIFNPSFEDGTNGWTVNKMQLQGNDGMSSYKAGDTYVERWIAAPGLLGSASVKQTVTGLSNGVYRLTAAAMNISQNNTNAAQMGSWIVGNGLRTAVTKLNTYTLDFFVTDGTAEIGFVCEGASGNWVGCDNFTLTFLGNTNTYIERAGNTVKNYADNLMGTYGSDSQYGNLVSTLASAINGGNINQVASAAKAVVAGERTYRLRHPSGAAPTVTTNKRHARGSIWIFGRLSRTGSNVVEEGFCYSTSPNPTLEDSYTTDWIDSYGKVIWMQDLTPGTMYYVRAYAMTKDYAVGYGDVIKVPTLPQGDIHWSLRNSGDETADNHIRSSCEWGFNHFWNNLTQLTSFWPSIGHVSGVPTAECSYGGWCSVGDNWSYQNTGTILHEMLHGVGVGQHWMWGDFTRNQYPVWDALRFWNNNETEVLNGDAQHMWPYGINGAHEDNGSDQLYIGNALVCEALGEGGLPLTDSQWLLPYYAFPQDDNTKYYIKCEDKNRGLTTSYLVEKSDGTLGWQAMSLAQAQSNDRAAWFVTFDASVQRYHIRNVSTNDYIRYSNGFSTGSSPTDIQMKKCRVDVNVGSHTYQGYYFLDYGSGQAMEAKADGGIGSTGFSIWDDATTQRWIILSEGADVEDFESGAVEIQLDVLRRYLNGYTAAKNVSHSDKTNGATTALSNTINAINSAIGGTVTMDQVLQYIEDIKAAGLDFLNNTMPSDNGYYDLTFLIENADFSESTKGWSLSPTWGNGAVEFYEKVFDFYQILPDMPAGKYQYTVDAFQRPGKPSEVYTAFSNGTDNVNAVMYINSSSQKVKNVMEGQQTTSISNGEFTTAGNTYIPNTMESGSNYMARNKYKNVMQGEFSAGDMRIGLRGTVSNAYYWTMADNFKLYYLGADGAVMSLKEELVNEGFNKITALPSDYSPYFFLLYDHDQDLTMVLKNPNHQGGSKSMWYDMDINPRTSKEPLWTLDAYTKDATEYQIITNATYPDVMLQTEWEAPWNYRCSDNGGGDPGWGRTSFEYQPAGYWTILSGVYPEWGYLGPWEGVFTDDAETALNKTDVNIGHFDIFTILRGDYVKRFDPGIQEASLDNPFDVTYILENPGAERRTSIGWTHVGNDWNSMDNNALTGKVGSRFMEQWNANGLGDAELYQKILGLPDGYYRFSAIATRRANETGAFYLYANDQQENIGGDNDGRRTSVTVQVTDGELQVGVKAENITKDWIAFDDARIEYLGLYLPDYIVGKPTSNINEGGYTGTQELTTWKLTFEEASSNVEGAVLVRLDNSARASLYKGETKVGDFLIYFSDNIATVSFNGVMLDADATYTLEFPAGVVGYAGQASNEAYAVTFNTPHYFTGTYYLYNKVTDNFLGIIQGNNEAYVTCAGSAITWTVSENGARIKFNDTNTYLGGFYWSTTDDAVGYEWEIIPYDEGNLSGYLLRRNPSPEGAWPGDYLYVSATEAERVASNGLIGDNFQDWAYAVWELWTQEEYDAYVNNCDLNNDGEITVSDVTKLVNIILYEDYDFYYRRADVNNDCSISVSDVTLMVNIILGKY